MTYTPFLLTRIYETIEVITILHCKATVIRDKLGDSMDISDEALEAAAKAMWGRVRIDPWEGATDHLAVEVFRADARLALEAAAPHLMAQALTEAAGIFQGRLPDGSGNGRAYNSYRVAAMLRDRAEEYRSAGAGE